MKLMPVVSILFLAAITTPKSALATNACCGCISLSGGGGGAAEWGDITGDIEDQTDLMSLLDGKQETGNYATSGTGDVTWSAPSGAGQVTTSIAATTVTGKAITGFSAGAGTVAGTDTILQAINKIVGNIAALTGATWGSITGASAQAVPSGGMTGNLVLNGATDGYSSGTAYKLWNDASGAIMSQTGPVFQALPASGQAHFFGFGSSAWRWASQDVNTMSLNTSLLHLLNSQSIRLGSGGGLIEFGKLSDGVAYISSGTQNGPKFDLAGDGSFMPHQDMDSIVKAKGFSTHVITTAKSISIQGGDKSNGFASVAGAATVRGGNCSVDDDDNCTPGALFLLGGSTDVGNAGADTTINGGTSGSGQQGQVKAPSGVSIVTTVSQPTCNSSRRGQFWIIQGGTGVADIFQICMKDAGDSYAWETK